MFPWLIPEWEQITKNMDRIPNAWLFEAEPGIGRNTFVKKLIYALLCENPQEGHEPCMECPSCKYLEKLSHPDFYDLMYNQLPEEHPVVDNDEVTVVKASGGRKAPVRRKSFKELRNEEEAGTVESLSTVIALKDETGYERTGLRYGEKSLPPIKIQTVREVLDKLDITASRQDRKVVLISPAELLTVEASNALLKSLEEPPRGVIFILVTENRDKLLPTIKSRCRLVHLPKPTFAQAEEFLARERPEMSPREVRAYLAFTGGCPLVEETPQETSLRSELMDLLENPNILGFLSYVQSYDKSKLPLSSFLDWFLKWLVDVASCQQGMGVEFYPEKERLAGMVCGAIDMGAPFVLIDRINHLLKYSSISLNVKIQIECLLIEYLRMHRN